MRYKASVYFFFLILEDTYLLFLEFMYMVERQEPSPSAMHSHYNFNNPYLFFHSSSACYLSLFGSVLMFVEVARSTYPGRVLGG